MPTIIQILIPIEHQTNCIMQNGKIYCEQNGMSAREAGMGFFLILALCGYMVWAAVKTENWNLAQSLALILAPFWLVAIVAIIHG